ncbi:Serine/threonine-protein kinase PknH [Anaerolineae bacterium]|nr:Serine/threonine-protein kinase PknH [Anaerolineae bacterium]
MSLEDDLLNLLSPFMGTNEERLAQIRRAFGTENPIEGQLTISGNTDTFILHLLKGLRRYGELPKGTPALWTLLLSIRGQVGVGKQQQIDGMKAAIFEVQAPWTAGAKIGWEGRYTLLEPLGEGGNGLVWRAEQRLPDGLPRLVAIKALKAEISRDKERVERFRHEMSLMARIGRAEKHLVEIYETDRHGEHEYSVMRLMEGGTLREVIRGKVFSVSEACFWLDQLGLALDYVHQRNLIHRDVKPENVLLSEDRRTLFLSDFGLVTSPDSDERLTSEGKPVGTGRYMAPEQWLKQPLSTHTDLYALGILAYELLTGHLPFDPTSGDLKLGTAHCEQPLPKDSHLSEALHRVLSRMTAKRSEDRYSSAREFVNALQQADIDPDTENLDRLIGSYLDYVERGIDDEVHSYIALKGTHRMLAAPPEAPAPKFGSRRHRTIDQVRQPMQADHHTEQGEPVTGDACDLLRKVERGGVLLGEPGTGKTWTLGRLVFDYADTWRDAPPGQRGQCLIPVLIPLNQFNGSRAREGKPDQPLSFDSYVRSKLDVLQPYYPRLLREGRLTFLCDALNEMPRQSALDGHDLVAEVREYLRDKPHYLVSCRVADYTLRPDLDTLKPLEQVRVREFDLHQIRQAIHTRMGREAGEELWVALGGNDRLFAFLEVLESRGEGDGFWDAQFDPYWHFDWEQVQAWRAMHSGARLIPLARNPFMLGVMGDIYQERGQIPSSRGKLFEEFVETLLEREESLSAQRGENFPPHDDIIVYLVELSRALQERRTTTLPYAEALGIAGGGDGEAQRLLIAAQSASILSDDGASYKFAHQLLQEYFAAKILLEAMEADEKAGSHARARALFGETWWDAGVWRETTVILGELLGEGAVGPNRVTRWLAPATPEVALEVITRNAGGLTVAEVETETQTALVNGAQAKAEYDFTTHTWGEVNPDPHGRASAWRALGKLRADKRPGVLDFNISWYKVPAGVFQMGGDPEVGYGAWEGARIPLDYDYWIAPYQVTYAQYAQFVADDGYTDKFRDCWTDAGWKWKGDKTSPGVYWNDPQWHILNHPVVGVTWYEAYAFTRWLNKRGLVTLPTAQPGYEVRLPTEAEWEKAARYPDGRKFPWGDEYLSGYANINETSGNVGPHYLQRTTAVGIYPQGKHDQIGAFDLSGNVWEWCLSKWAKPYQHPEDNAPEGDSSRCLRGGSWYLHQGVARAAWRRYDVGLRYFTFGFRVVVAPVSIGVSSVL